MLVIKNIDKIVDSQVTKYTISSVKDFINSYSFAIMDMDDARFFRIDLMKEREDGKWALRYSPTKFFKIEDDVIKDRNKLLLEMVSLVITYRKPIKNKK